MDRGTQVLAGLLRASAGLLPAAASNNDQLALQVPDDGTVDSLWELLDELHRARVDVERLSFDTPDLDDVFLALTGSHVTAEPDGDLAPQGVA